MAGSRFSRTVLEEDVQSVDKAWNEYRVQVMKVYTFYRQSRKVGLINRSPELCRLAEEWQDVAELVVATTFDLAYLPAQRKRRHKLGANTDELHATIVDVQARHDAAKAKLPDITPRLQKLYDSLK
jgi:hypothetical protein